MTDTAIRLAVLDLATEDYTPLWVLARTLAPDPTEETIRRVVGNMLRDGALRLFRGDHFVGEETAIVDAGEIAAMLRDSASWRPPDAAYSLAIVSTDEGSREYYRAGRESD